MSKNIIYAILFIIITLILSVVSSPSFGMSFLVIFAFVPLFAAVRLKLTNPFLSGYIFGVIYYFYSLYWITVAVTYYGNAPIFVSWMMLLVLSGYLSLFWGIFTYILARYKNCVLIATVFVLLEICKSTLFTGFPWLNLGSFFYNNQLFLPIASIVGEHGLTFIIILLNVTAADFAISKEKKMAFLFTVILFLSVVVSFVVVKTRYGYSKSISATVIQPSYAQEIKWEHSKRREVINTVYSLIERNIGNNSDIIVLPESSFPTVVERDYFLYKKLQDMSIVKPILLGNIRISEQDGKVYNSMIFIDNKTTSYYDKIHLVPFGEYFPFQKLLNPIKEYFFGKADDFSSGDTVRLFNYKGTNLAPLICYEGAFYDLAQKSVSKGGDIFVFATNDSWFGVSYGRYQHLAIDVMRSAESGKGIIRATQSGISACIQPWGKIDKLLESNLSGALECNISVNEQGSVFNKIKYYWLYMVVIAVASLKFFRKRY